MHRVFIGAIFMSFVGCVSACSYLKSKNKNTEDWESKKSRLCKELAPNQLDLSKYKKKWQKDKSAFIKVMTAHFKDEEVITKGQKYAKEQGLFTFPAGIYYVTKREDSNAKGRESIYTALVEETDKYPSALNLFASQSVESSDINIGIDASNELTVYVQSFFETAPLKKEWFDEMISRFCRL